MSLVTDDTGDEFAAHGSGWDSLSIRHAFIRKVKHTHHTNHALAPASVSCVITLESRSQIYLFIYIEVIWYFIHNQVLKCFCLCQTFGKEEMWDMIGVGAGVGWIECLETAGCNVSFVCMCFLRCIWFWPLSSSSPQPLWPCSRLCEYTECVFCVHVSMCIALLTVFLFPTANLSGFSCRETELSTGRLSKSHSEVTSLHLKLCAFTELKINIM